MKKQKPEEAKSTGKTAASVRAAAQSISTSTPVGPPTNLDFEKSLMFFHAYMYGPLQGKLRLYGARKIPPGSVELSGPGSHYFEKSGLLKINARLARLTEWASKSVGRGDRKWQFKDCAARFVIAGSCPGTVRSSSVHSFRSGCGSVWLPSRQAPASP